MKIDKHSEIKFNSGKILEEEKLFFFLHLSPYVPLEMLLLYSDINWFTVCIHNIRCDTTRKVKVYKQPHRRRPLRIHCRFAGWCSKNNTYPMVVVVAPVAHLGS